jgi:molybdenum cofactor cytidylyltransferase
VREAHGRVAAVVLAAGCSTRMGRSKQTLPWGDTTMIGEVVRRLQASGLSEIVVVTGAERESVEAALAEGPRSEAQGEAASVRFAFNPDFETSEMARSLQVGLRGLSENCTAALVALGDQPQLEPETARAVIQRWRETLASVVAPIYQGQRGHPLLFDRSAWPGLFELPAAANPREFLRAAGRIELVETDADSILRDIDTPDDYERERRA